MRQNGALAAPNPLAVRAAMPQNLRHAIGGVDTCPRTDDSRYAAHGRQSNAPLTMWR
jgi:hypothetical protein